jgi:hypothetical protein
MRACSPSTAGEMSIAVEQGRFLLTANRLGRGILLSVDSKSKGKVLSGGES